MADYDYDLLVIGSGPAGQRAAIQAAKLNKRVAVVERKAILGGVCINTGTIPSKTLREAVLHLSGYREHSLYGASYTVKQNITMADLLYRMKPSDAFSSVFAPTYPRLTKANSLANDATPTFAEIEAGAYSDVRYMAYVDFGASAQGALYGSVLDTPMQSALRQDTSRSSVAGPTAAQLRRVQQLMRDGRTRPRRPSAGVQAPHTPLPALSPDGR